MSDSQNSKHDSALDVTRRYFLGRGAGVGLGAMALNLLDGESRDPQAAGAVSSGWLRVIRGDV